MTEIDTIAQRFSEVKNVSKIIPFLKDSTVRWLIYSNPEFSKKCVFRVGRKVLIGIPELLKFIEDGNHKK